MQLWTWFLTVQTNYFNVRVAKLATKEDKPMDINIINRHERDILKLKIEIKQLNLKINKKNAEIEELREWNRQIKGGN